MQQEDDRQDNRDDAQPEEQHPVDRREEDADIRAVHFRSNSRIFHVNGQWFFSTRDGEQGPYKTEEIAKRELEIFVLMASSQIKKQKEKAEANEEEAPDPSVWDKFNFSG